MTAAQKLGLAVTLFLGVVNFIWNFYNALRSRRFSVDDDFWFRKIIGPYVVEKSLTFVEKWASSDLLSGARTKAKIRTDLAEFKSEKNSLLEYFVCIQLFSASCYRSACAHIDAIEDDLTNTCYAMSSGLQNRQVSVMQCESSQAFMRNEIFALLGDLKAMQERL